MKKNVEEIGVYVHIPFCKKKCNYCDFVSFAGLEKLQEQYVNVLVNEIDDFFANNVNVKIKTIYIGGGTPSCIESKYIKQILEHLNKKEAREISIEVNPGTVDEEKLYAYKNSGINRLSIGLQTTDDKLLKKMGRIHTFSDFLSTYKMAKQIGFENINVDLMIGLPGQTINGIKETLEKVTNLNPSHVSVYSLIIEENTLIEKMVRNKQISLPSEDLERDMYWYVKNYLELKGYTHYEISNFAKKGYKSIHNLDCWEQKEYVGFGLSAHSYFHEKRFCNTSIFEKYLNDYKNTKDVLEIQDDFSKKQEYMLLGLRKIEGVSIKLFKNKFGENPIFLFKDELNKLCKEGLLQILGDYIRLTPKGLDLANLVWEEFVAG